MTSLSTADTLRAAALEYYRRDGELNRATERWHNRPREDTATAQAIRNSIEMAHDQAAGRASAAFRRLYDAIAALAAEA